MNEHTEKSIIAFTSQSLRQNGIRGVRMDDIAKSMTVSKRTIYQIYATKDNLVNICFNSYLNRVENLFQIIKCSSQDTVTELWEDSKAYIENLYRAECSFWSDINRSLEYKYIYTKHNCVWFAQLERIITVCQQGKYIINDLNVQMFIESYMSVLYHARTVECAPSVLHNSAYYMLRGIMTEQGLERFKTFVFRP